MCAARKQANNHQMQSVSFMELFFDAHSVCLDNWDIMMPPTSKCMTPVWWGNPSTLNTG